MRALRFLCNAQELSDIMSMMMIMIMITMMMIIQCKT